MRTANQLVGHFLRRSMDKSKSALLAASGIIVRERFVRKTVGEVSAILENGQNLSIPLEKWIRPIPSTGPIYVSPLGMVVKGGRLLADYCSIGPNFFEARTAIYSRLREGANLSVLPQGTVCGMSHPLTYGVWFRHGLLTLCSTEIRPPLVLPKRFLYEREYVRRDLDRLGIDVHVLDDCGVAIANPLLLAPSGPFFEWLPGEIDKIRSCMNISAVTPRPGSLLYLSREGEVAGSIDRKYMSQCIEDLTRGLGGRVVRTKDTRFDEYIGMGLDAETVIADHGSAQCNLAWFGTKKVIEIQSTHKNMYFVTLSASAGVMQRFVIDSNGKNESQLQAAVTKAVDRGHPLPRVRFRGKS